MKLTKIPLFMWEDERKDVYDVEVPSESVQVGAKVMHEGIYLWYEVPNIVTSTRVDRYKVMMTDNDIPEGAKIVTILDSIVELEGGADGNASGQGIVIFPIYKLK